MSGDKGLSLIELVIAMALFALVSVMGMQTLNGTIRTRDALTARDDRDQALAVAVALLRSDLEHMAPLLFFPPDGPPESALYQTATQERIGLTIAAPAGTVSPFQRSEWLFDPISGALSRAVWPVTTPANASQRSPERVFLTGVQALRLRSYWIGLGWVDGTGADASIKSPPPDSSDGDNALVLIANSYSDTLPVAIEITVVLDGFGEIRLVEALQ